MNSDEQLKYQIALMLLPGVGSVLAKNLVSYCGSVEDIFKRKKAQLEKIPGIGEERAAAIVNQNVFERAEMEVTFVRRHKISSMFYLDQEYPARLKNCDDSPPLLFFKGNVELNPPRMVAIVGTRNATSYGKEITEQLVADLAKYETTIISGLAYGIDIAVHKACLKNSVTTIGVLAHGLDRIYPSIHKPTAEKMVNNGGVLTEFMSLTNPDRENFPSRNRIVAGMVDAVIVVESAIKGGALITADIANGYNREVFAVPGRANEKYSQGCNDFIRQNKAALAENAEHIAELMNWNTTEKKKSDKQFYIFRELNEEEKKLIDILQQNGKLDIDSLMLHSGLPVHKVSSTLLNLEFEGILKVLPGKIFELL